MITSESAIDALTCDDRVVPTKGMQVQT